MKRVRILVLLLLGLPAAGRAQVTLDECQRLARENYPAIAQFDLVERSRDMNLSNAARSWLPQFSLTAIGGYMGGLPEISLPGSTAKNGHNQFIGIAQLNQPVWDGGASRANRRIAEASAEVDRHSLEVMLHGIREKVCDLFFGALLLDEQLRAADLLDENYARNLARIETALANGAALASDRDALRAERLTLRQNRVALETSQQNYLQMLSFMTGRDIDSASELTLPPQAVATAGSSRPELELYDAQIRLSGARDRLLTARIMPRVGLMAYGVGMTPGVNFGTSKLDHLVVAGLSVSWSIGGLYTRGNDRNMLKINQAQVASQRETFLFNNRLELTGLESEAEKFRRQMAEDDEIIALRESVRRATELKYENGICTVTDLIRDVNAESTARITRASHALQYRHNVYKYNIIK